MSEKNRVLTAIQIDQKVRRIALEIYEKNAEETSIFLAGIWDRGYQFAQLLADHLRQVSPLKVELVKVDVDKSNPLQAEVTFDISSDRLKDACIVLVDDVLNSGRTMAYAMKPFLDLPMKKLETAVLVLRTHRLFPISSRYTGYELATTLNEHIDVVLDGDHKGVYLA
ncbi:MAG: phosphoribosyltransferase family protein [Bacteroidota bacterium]